MAVKYLRNAELLMDQRGLSEDLVTEIVENLDKKVVSSDDSDETGTVVSEGIVNNRRVRVTFSKDSTYGGSPEDPLVINTMVLGSIAPPV